MRYQVTVDFWVDAGEGPMGESVAGSRILNILNDTALQGDEDFCIREVTEAPASRYRYCEDCGVELGSGDPHNPEAHLAEMRAEVDHSDREQAWYDRPDDLEDDDA